MKAVLLAAGKGTRMGELTRTTPKPLLLVNGKPILAHIIEGMASAGIREFVVVTGHLGDQIENAFGDGSRLGVSIVYRRQRRADGTGAALLLARDLLSDTPFMLSWGDIIVDADLYRTMRSRFESAPCDALLSVNRVDDPWRGAAVYVGDKNRVERIVEKPPRGSSTTQWNNAGIFVFSPLILEYTARLTPSSRGEYELPQAIARMVVDGREVRAVPVGEFWSDVGTPKDLELLQSRPLIETFRGHFGAAPDAIVSAPGRVNLIGEHTDYNGLPVLPIAIDRCVRIAVRRREDRKVLLANVDERFAACEYEVAADVPAFGPGSWGNYHKAAVQGIVRHGRDDRQWRGAEFLVDGDVPKGAGLSSSSALVVASGLAFLEANDVEVPRTDLAELLAQAERYVGTLSGGMDQAVSLLARAGQALRIDFFPLRMRTVELPAGIAVVVCDSLVQAEKSGDARAAYNTRVIECRLACRAMERALGDTLTQPLLRLGDLTHVFPGRRLIEFTDALAAIVPDRSLSLPEIARIIGTNEADLRRSCEIPSQIADRFSILRRARHVLSEGDRVDRAEAALTAGELQRFGSLMLKSHVSCRDDYEVSCSALDELVDVAVAAGAFGSRLTGAGFGGCTVSLVAAAQIEPFLVAVDRDFYRARLAPGDDPSRHRFVLTAREGATVTKLN